MEVWHDVSESFQGILTNHIFLPSYKYQLIVRAMYFDSENAKDLKREE